MYLEIEEKLIGTYANTPSLFDGIDHLVGAHLFTGVNKNAYKFIKNNHAKNVFTDGASLYNNLKSLGYPEKGLKEICIKLTTADAITKMSPKEGVIILFDNYTREVMKPILHQTYLDLNSGIGNVQDVISVVKNKITDIDAVINNVQKTTTITEVFDSALTRLKELKEKKVEPGYRIGLGDLMIMKGITVIGAAPGMGKSSLVVSIIKNLAIDKDVPMVFFSIEMSAEQIVTNLWANMFGFNTNKLTLGDVTDEEYARIEASRKKFRNNITIDDNPNITYKYVESVFKQIRKKVPMKTMIVGFIDYIQIMGSCPEDARENSETRMSIKCNNLANLAKQYNVGLIELSQLVRDIAKRPSGPRPVMTDLKESGAIEANAQQIWLMYRPDYYDPNPVDGQGNDLRGLCEINKAKNRYGSTGATYVKFAKQYSQFLDREENQF